MTAAVSTAVPVNLEEKPLIQIFPAPSTVEAIATSSLPESITFCQRTTPAPSTAVSATSVVTESTVAMVIIDAFDTSSICAFGASTTVVIFFTATFF